MLEIDTSSKSEQRKFGLVMAAAIAALGMIRWAFHGFEGFPANFCMVAGVFLAFGLALPKALRPVFVLWMKFATLLNWVMTRVLLGLAFYLMITPVRVLVALFSEDPLNRAWLPGADSYWEEAEEQPEEFDRYRKQY